VSSEIELPVSASVACEAYSDLTRMPNWSSWLESVVILNNGAPNDNGRVESKWTAKVMGVRYSWTAEAIETDNEEPYTIRWRSITGLRNEGTVTFCPKDANNHSSDDNKVPTTMMKLDMVFSMPSAVSSILRRTGKLSRFVEKIILAKSLRGFRDVVVLEQQHKLPAEDHAVVCDVSHTHVGIY